MTTFTVDDPQKRFFVQGGTALGSMEELFLELQLMEKWQFDHHVNDQRHDFAAWTRDVFGDRFLAKQMEQAKTIEDLQKVVFVSLFR